MDKNTNKGGCRRWKKSHKKIVFFPFFFSCFLSLGWRARASARASARARASASVRARERMKFFFKLFLFHLNFLGFFSQVWLCINNFFDLLNGSGGSSLPSRQHLTDRFRFRFRCHPFASTSLPLPASLPWKSRAAIAVYASAASRCRVTDRNCWEPIKGSKSLKNDVFRIILTEKEIFLHL